MGKTSIEWTDASWNPVVGCTEVSPGCANCYAARLASTRLRNHPDYAGLAIHRVNSGRWTGEVRFLQERLEEPMHWKKPRRIFVCDMGDLFHESVTDQQIVEVFKIIALGGGMGHTFQVLTKRPKRMREFISKDHGVEWVRPMPWLWLGTSVENQHFADERIPELLATPAAVRFLSCEPLLGPVDLELAQCSCPMRIPFGGQTRHLLSCKADCRRPDDATRWALHWVICGGESGPGARPMHPDWARSLRDQCQAAGVPFFFKQWGSLVQSERTGLFVRTPKKKAGRLLDGREWNEFPKASR